MIEALVCLILTWNPSEPEFLPSAAIRECDRPALFELRPELHLAPIAEDIPVTNLAAHEDASNVGGERRDLHLIAAQTAEAAGMASGGYDGCLEEASDPIDGRFPRGLKRQGGEEESGPVIHLSCGRLPSVVDVEAEQNIFVGLQRFGKIGRDGQVGPNLRLACFTGILDSPAGK